VSTPKVIISKRLLLVNSASSVLSKVINLTVLLWLHQFLIKRVDAGEYSLLAIVTSLLIFAPLLSTVLTSGMGRFAVRAYAKGDRDSLTRIVSSMLPLLLTTALVLLLLGALASWNVGRILKIPPERLNDAQIMAAMLFAAVALRIVSAPFGIGLYVSQKFVLSSILDLVGQLLKLAMLAGLFASFETRVLWVVLANFASELCMTAIRIRISRRLHPELTFKLAYAERRAAFDLLQFQGWNFISQLGVTIRDSADPLILNRFATAVEVSAFQLGAIADRNFKTLLSTALSALAPALTALHAVDARERLQRASLAVTRYSTYLAIGVAAPMLIFREEIYKMYLGEKYGIYSTATTVMALLLVTYPLRYAGSLVFKVANPTGRVRGVSLLMLVGQLANLGLTFYLVGHLHLGAIGSALATFITDILNYCFGYIPLGLRIAGITSRRWLTEVIVPCLIPGFCGVFVWGAAKNLFQPDSPVQLLSCITAGAVCYAGAVLFLSAQPQEQAYLRTVLVRLLARRGLRTAVT
jgi:O-antigen/teichoic acid export membrane protein